MAGESKRKMILLIDDEAVGSALYEIVFPYRFTVATSGLRGLEVLAREKNEIDLVLLDYRMPELTGLEVLPMVKQLCPEIPVLMFTSDPGIREAAFKLGADGFLDKTQDPEEIMNALDTFFVLGIRNRHVR